MATDFQPPLVSVRLDRLAAELRALELDVEGFCFWAEMSPAHVRAVMSSGKASPATLRRMCRGLRVAWTAKDPDPSRIARVRRSYLTEAAA